MKKKYTIKSKKLGFINVSFSNHASKRMVERNIDLLDILLSLTLSSDDICVAKDNCMILLLNEEKEISILLSITHMTNCIHYFNLVTLLNYIPRKQDGTLKFYNISSCITA